MQFDSRAIILDAKIKDSWIPRVKKQWIENKKRAEEEMKLQYGYLGFDIKLRNIKDLGAAPFSIIAFHNKFLHQSRESFIIGAYYPSLTGACSLGERILNHLMLRLRKYYISTKEYKKIYNKKSFDNWTSVIKILKSWGIFSTEVETEYLELKRIRDDAIHFRIETDKNDRGHALEAIKKISKIVSLQFGAINKRWMIPSTPGISFVRKDIENEPFVKEIVLPNCRLVGPLHTLDYKNNKWLVIDKTRYPKKDISDEEFSRMFREKCIVG